MVFKSVLTTILMVLLLASGSLASGPISDKISDHILNLFEFDPDYTEIECRQELDSIMITDSTIITISCREYPIPDGYFPLKVVLQEGSGGVRSIATSVFVRFYKDVLVAQDKVKSRNPVMPSDFEIQRMEIGKIVGTPVEEFQDLEGMRSSRTISRGKILTHEMLEEIPVIRRGERVRIVYKSGTLTVESYGIARRDAVEGEMIEVKNTASGKRIFGRASAEGDVLVER